MCPCLLCWRCTGRRAEQESRVSERHTGLLARRKSFCFRTPRPTIHPSINAQGGGEGSGRKGCCFTEEARRAIDSTPELCYLTHVVLRMFEDVDKARIGVL